MATLCVHTISCGCCLHCCTVTLTLIIRVQLVACKSCLDHHELVRQPRLEYGRMGFTIFFTNHYIILQSLDLCQCCANLGVPVVAANGWAAMKAIVLRNLSARRAARRRVEIFVWTVDDERQGSGDSVTGAPSPLQGDPSPRKPGLG